MVACLADITADARGVLRAEAGARCRIAVAEEARAPAALALSRSRRRILARGAIGAHRAVDLAGELAGRARVAAGAAAARADVAFGANFTEIARALGGAVQAHGAHSVALVGPAVAGARLALALTEVQLELVGRARCGRTFKEKQ
jgi:hypothetical protein